MDENTVDTTDRISMLPDFIVHHILSYLLDDPISCVRVSVLSKEWFALTASCPFLNFTYDDWNYLFSREYDDVMEKFYKYVEYTVSRFCEQNISAHTLNISATIINFEEIELFEHCLPMFRLPNTLLSASSLTSLTLQKCELPSSLMIGVVKFKSLRLLSLTFLLIEEDVEELRLMQSPAYELEHVDLVETYYTTNIRESSVYVALVDAVLWCCRPRSLTLVLYHYTEIGDVVEYTYEKLLQQEDEGQTNIKFVLIYFDKDDEQHFSDLNSLLKALSLDQLSCKITFIKEEDDSGCTTLDEIASHVYRSWVKAFDVKPLDFELRLTFSVNTRSKFKNPPLKGLYGNVVCVACGTSTVSGLVSGSLQDVTRLFRDARLRISEDYIMIY
ncbi:HXXXD-type acyl-transferase family protein [Artemisia annua]|uniref:HXXXD-type acyl-transferase family protein n=1 Tax=Artemisia annua TaxID=35608 RepID=A0A2U1LRM0_ARTAN|nr:HXXXD-type acyl-transferase family protein [Artemisia annua]